jgi:acetyl esterase
LLGRAALGLLNLPDPVLTSLLGPMPVSDRGIALDLRMAALLRGIALMGLDRPGPVEAARKHMDGSAPLVDVPPLAGIDVRDEQVPGPAGPLRARVYRPSGRRDGGELPILVYLHGGGFVLGSAQSHDGVVRLLAQRSRCVVVSLEYRLAPEHRFPAAVEDAIAGYRHVREHAARLGGRSDRVAIGGDSAGGNLAAVVCQQLLALGEPPPFLQALIYPATDLRRVHDSHEHFAKGFFLSREMMDWFVGAYVGDPSELEDPRASPLLGDRFEGLPPALIVTAGFDPLRDEGHAYADKLRKAGVPVEQRCAERLVHGFFNMGGAIPAARETVRDYADALRVQLHG